MKKITTSTLFMLLAVFAMAQPDFTYNDMPNVGDNDSLKFIPLYKASANLDSETGNNYSWDFTSLKFHNAFWAIDSYMVRTHLLDTNFKNATLEYYHTSSAGSALELYDYKNDTLRLYRTGTVTSGTNFLPPIGITKLPLKINSESKILAPIFFGKRQTGERLTLTTYDGFGSIKLPGNKTYNNVFRIKKVIKDSTYITKFTTSYISYTWFAQGGDVPILRLSKIEFNGTANPNFNLYMKKSGVSTNPGTSVNQQNVANNNIQLYPNPSNTGNFSIKTENTTIEALNIYNYTGSLIYQATNQELNSGVVQPNLPTGTYIVLMQHNNHITQRKLLVK